MMQLCLYFFKFCGFYPVKIGKIEKNCENNQTEKAMKFRQSLVSLLWSSLHCATIATFMAFVVIFSDKIIYSETPIGKINDILVYFSMVFAHFAIVVETFVKRKYLLKFWYHHRKLKKFNKRNRSGNWEKLILLKTISLVAFTITSEYLVISGIGSDEQWTNFWVASVFSLCLTRFRHLQHIFFIDIIYFSLEDTNWRLRNTISWTEAIGENKKISRLFLYKNLKNTKEQFKSLMEMLICVNKVFCWSQVFNIGQHFVEITSELYWIYAYAIGPKFLWGKIWRALKMKTSKNSLNISLSIHFVYLSHTNCFPANCRHYHYAPELSDKMH